MSVVSAPAKEHRKIEITKVDPTYGGVLKVTSVKTYKSSLKHVPSKTTSEKKADEEEEELEVLSKFSEDLSQRMSVMGKLEKTPLEQDLEIQTGRIMYVLDKAIKKIELTACLPMFLRDHAKKLHDHLEPVEADFVLDVFSEYVDMELGAFTEEQLSNIARISKIINDISMTQKKYSSRKISLSNSRGQLLVDPHMMQALDILCNNKSIKLIIEQYLPKIDAQAKEFLNCLYTLKQAAKQKFSVSASQERERVKELRKAWMENIDAKENIANVQKQLNKQREELGAQLAKKKMVLETYKQKIEDMRETFKANIKKRILQSEQGMVEDTQASEVRREELAIDAKQAQQQYQNLLDQHLAYESGLRAKRFKVETQLASWVAKYDADMGERQAEFEEITKGYEEEKAEMEALQAKFDEQDEEYEVLMAEKEEEEQKIFEELAYAFLKNRSARIIQRAWREYRERKRARKKAKKAKKPVAAPKPKAKKPKKKEKVKTKKRTKPELTPDKMLTSKDDPNAMLANKFKGGVLDDLDPTKNFSKGDVAVDLSGN